MANDQSLRSPAPLQDFEPAVELLQDAPEETAASGCDLSVRQAEGAPAGDAAVEPPPPVVAEEEVHRSTLADRWREHVEASRRKEE